MREKIYNLLMVTHRGLLENCCRQVFSGDGGLQAAKTFEDYLDDFYLYLYEAKPKFVEEDVKGYYLQQIRDEKAVPSWLWQTFKRFLLEEHLTMTEMREALAEYRTRLAAAEDSHTVDITQGNLRTRTSRLCAKVKRLVSDISDALISSLNKQALDIAMNIYDDPFPQLQNILEELLGQAERELEQYDEPVARRREKRISAAMLFDKIEASLDAYLDTLPVPAKRIRDRINYCIEPDRASDTGNSIIRKFKELIGM